jgi:hypothetical protein
MVVDERLERLYRQVELVRGVGEPKSGKLCVMSFVAFLAGEVHSDRPAAASSLIRELAVRINDAMPQEIRQELKPFVPRILGTNDGCDGERAAMLRAVTEAEIMPRICRDFLVSGRLRSWRRSGEFRELSSKLFGLTESWSKPEHALPDVKLCAAVTDLLCFCAAKASDADSGRWYWEKAIDVLDRACDIREDSSSSRVDETRLRELEEILAGRVPNRRRPPITKSMVECIRLLVVRPLKTL